MRPLWTVARWKRRGVQPFTEAVTYRGATQCSLSRSKAVRMLMIKSNVRPGGAVRAVPDVVLVGIGGIDAAQEPQLVCVVEGLVGRARAERGAARHRRPRHCGRTEETRQRQHANPRQTLQPAGHQAGHGTGTHGLGWSTTEPRRRGCCQQFCRQSQRSGQRKKTPHHGHQIQRQGSKTLEAAGSTSSASERSQCRQLR